MAIITGTPDDDMLFGEADDDILYGLSGSDILYGKEGNDVLYGGNGLDFLSGGDGDDWFHGGGGNDRLMGALGNDTYVFGIGSFQDFIDNEDSAWESSTDRLLFQAGITPAGVTLTRDATDLFVTIDSTDEEVRVFDHFNHTGDDIDYIEFANGTIWDWDYILANVQARGINNVVIGSDSADVLDGLSGDDAISSRGGDDIIDGGLNSDGLYGGDGADTLRGGDGSDTLRGEAGNDILYGGRGMDSLNGGGGKDVFVFDTALHGIGNVDKISGYNVSRDVIHLDNAVFTQLGLAGALDANFFTSGTSGHAGDANDYIIFESDTGKLFYDADGNGAGASVLFATLVGNPEISAADFVVI